MALWLGSLPKEEGFRVEAGAQILTKFLKGLDS